MNWKVFEQRYPNCYPEIREFFTNNTDKIEGDRDRILMHKFFNDKGILTGAMFIYALREYESQAKAINNLNNK